MFTFATRLNELEEMLVFLERKREKSFFKKSKIILVWLNLIITFATRLNEQENKKEIRRRN